MCVVLYADGKMARGAMRRGRSRRCIRRWRVVEKRACAASSSSVAKGEREDAIHECGAYIINLRGVLSSDSARTDRSRRRVYSWMTTRRARRGAAKGVGERKANEGVGQRARRGRRSEIERAVMWSQGERWRGERATPGYEYK
ncbi:hypothetical protein CERSUDRAFT_109789 [Gelatoporia subvermispora B]|uniref:Uncharacterized protein n=1 Tax=Ceriporiopsis subvermispora (strain B) TaxID=914234 RepID=M2QVJ4_CERS8|nr:hypothetical protein CERSUDRAFT_109789 [Gelatoporia subvermispora B]